MTTEEQAVKVGNTPALLRRRLVDAIDCLKPEHRRLFRGQGVRFDAVARCLISADGGAVLQWSLRRFPDRPIDYHNQQTNRGGVSLYI